MSNVTSSCNIFQEDNKARQALNPNEPVRNNTKNKNFNLASPLELPSLSAGTKKHYRQIIGQFGMTQIVFWFSDIYRTRFDLFGLELYCLEWEW